MKYPRNIYVASVDPMHFSHLNTMKTAEKMLGQSVNLVICKNDLKEGGFFSLKERKEIAKLYLGQNEQVFVTDNFEEIRTFLFNAEKVVRGIREESDLEYIAKLGKYYNVESLKSKLILIPVPDDYRAISSTNIKEFVRKGDINRVRGCVHEEIIKKIQSKYDKVLID